MASALPSAITVHTPTSTDRATSKISLKGPDALAVALPNATSEPPEPAASTSRDTVSPLENPDPLTVIDPPSRTPEGEITILATIWGRGGLLARAGRGRPPLPEALALAGGHSL